MKTIYVDTSVFGGKFDPEFELWTNLFFKKVIGSGRVERERIANDTEGKSPKEILEHFSKRSQKKAAKGLSRSESDQ